MKYFLTVAGGFFLGHILAETDDWRILIAYVLGGAGAFMFGVNQ